MKIKNKKLLKSNQYIGYRTQPKAFQLQINKPKAKNPNPLYSTDSLAKYFNLPTTDLNLTINRTHRTKQKDSIISSTQQLKMFRDHKIITKFNQMQQNLRIYQKQGTIPAKRKFKIMQEYHNKIQDHFNKIKNSTNQEDYPKIQIGLDIGFDNRYTKAQEGQNRRRILSLASKTVQLRKKLHAQNIRNYLQQQEIWTRYGYSLEVDDQQQWIKSSIQRRNKFLRSKYHSMDSRPKVLKLKKVINKQILEDSKYYMKMKMKTEGDAL